MDLEWWAVWGFLGAFVYGVQRLVIAMAEARATKAPLGHKAVEFTVALTIGPIFAVGFGPWGAEYVGARGEQVARAIALIIGMVANPLAPALVKLVSGEILRRIGSSFGGDRPQ